MRSKPSAFICAKTGSEQPLFCTYGYNVTVGDNFFLNVNGKLMDSGKITIGNDVWIAAGALTYNNGWQIGTFSESA